MQLKKKSMKFINKKTLTTLFLFVFAIHFSQVKRQKIDGVVGVVGDFVILDSDIDLEYITLRAESVDISKISRCELLGKKLEDKLYAHHAIQDSIVVTDMEVNAFLNEQLDVAVEQIGSMEKVVKYYNKKNEEELRNHFFDVVKMNKLTSQMQKKIIDEVEVTPEEVRNFFRQIPEDEIPIFGAEVEVAQIIIKPKFLRKKNKKWSTSSKKLEQKF